MTGPVLTLFAPGVGTIVVTMRRLITLRTCTGPDRGGRPAQRGIGADAQLVGEEGEEHREERDRAPEHRTGAGAAAAARASVIVTTLGLVPRRHRLRRRWSRS